jgi:hypothetical protein
MSDAAAKFPRPMRSQRRQFRFRWVVSKEPTTTQWDDDGDFFGCSLGVCMRTDREDVLTNCRRPIAIEGWLRANRFLAYRSSA